MNRALNVLMCSTPVAGHVNPGLPIARALTERGHNVRWYSGSVFQRAIESTGAIFEPIVDAHDPADVSLDERFPERVGLEGLGGLRFDLEHLFLDEAPAQIRDLQRIRTRFDVDVMVVDTAFSAASMLHELGGPPFASYGISILPIPSRDLPPLGSGQPPRRSSIRRHTDRLLVPAITRALFRGVQRHHLDVRAQLGLAPTRKTVFDTFVSPYLYLHASAESFEYPRSDLPPQVHFIGPLLPAPPARFTPPDWWDQLDGPRPVVLVNQGTVAVDLDDLVVPALAGLADEDVVVIATGGVGRSGLATAVPSNAHVEAFVPFAALMPHVDVMVTNGGYGGVQQALAHGVPLVVAGNTEDKPEVAARVAWSGAGIDLRTRKPTPERIRDAVRAVLRDDTYRHHARRLRGEAAQLDAPVAAAGLIELLATTGRPVHRDSVSADLPALGPIEGAHVTLSD